MPKHSGKSKNSSQGPHSEKSNDLSGVTFTQSLFAEFGVNSEKELLAKLVRESNSVPCVCCKRKFSIETGKEIRETEEDLERQDDVERTIHFLYDGNPWCSECMVTRYDEYYLEQCNAEFGDNYD